MKVTEKIKNDINTMIVDMPDDRESLILFKNLAVKTKNYELAAQLRELEVNYLPKQLTKDSKEYKTAKNTETILRMVDIQADLQTAYVIHEVMKLFFAKGGKIDLRSCSKIITDSKAKFDDEKRG